MTMGNSNSLVVSRSTKILSSTGFTIRATRAVVPDSTAPQSMDQRSRARYGRTYPEATIGFHTYCLTPLAPLTIQQADFVFWPPPTMIDPVPQVVGMALQGIASDVWSPRGKRGLHSCCRPRSQPFIGVEAEYPLMGRVA